jgi:hypothetical protein
MDKRLCLAFGLTAVLWIGLLPLGAAPTVNGSMPPDPVSSQTDLCHRGEVTVYPPNPSAVDPVSIVASGWWGSSCPAVTSQHYMIGHSITLSITVTDLVAVPPVACLDVVTPWTITQEIGTLPLGDYTVQADCNAGPCWSFQARTTFRVWAPTGMFWRYLPAVLRASMQP